MFNTIPQILEDLKAGKMVVVVDDCERENEGDLVLPAQNATPPNINFMAKFGRGLICIAMEEERLTQLNLFSLAETIKTTQKKDPFSTAWMISVDAARGITTGISAYDRARTIEVLIDPQATPEDLVKPGHLFPLKARKGGVLVRSGHTEATVDLMRLAGLYPAGVICEVMDEDGSMARLPKLVEFACAHNLKICSIADLIQYRRRNEKFVECISSCSLPTEFGAFNLLMYRDRIDNEKHVALVMGDVSGQEPVLVRVHSQCLTGDVFLSLRCDCGKQLRRSMQMISEEKKGVILYMQQEGRGIGFTNKVHAYHLQDKGMDTVEANEALGFKPDLRDYGIGAQILVDLGLKNIRLLTNNPRKIVGLEGFGLKVVERASLEIEPTPENFNYLKTKKEKLGHQLDNV
ncbi:MAG: bifunctional 3,4-dihydroxy-2-butanone-4-phosphate synthase/GTP cyclohydrolase II [Candidatus Omnitrophica bacterium]|nr:bifunctional 3,4-dihydroxy-2-butanone-4-phosphate synthase/GTP cyclohydrolase II [Candidatus Omnitrophota bacterium]